MNANSQLNELIKKVKDKKPNWFNKGNLYIKTFVETPKEETTEKVLTDEDLGLKPARRVKSIEGKGE